MSGRPFRKVDDPKSALIKFRVTPADKELIETKARECNLSVAQYLTRLALAKQLRAQGDYHTVFELRAFTEQLRELYFSGTPPKDEQLRPLLAGAVQALQRIAAGRAALL